MIENEASVKGRVIAELLSHLTNDLQIGKKIKSGELRKRLKEPAWHVPECFNMTNIDMENFSMKLLSLKENPGQDYVILQLHGGGYMGAVRNAYYVFAGLYNEVSKGCNVLTPDYRVAPEHPYPAALEDALASYQWLLDKGYYGEQIIVAGITLRGCPTQGPRLARYLSGLFTYSIWGWKRRPSIVPPTTARARSSLRPLASRAMRARWLRSRAST